MIRADCDGSPFCDLAKLGTTKPGPGVTNAVAAAFVFVFVFVFVKGVDAFNQSYCGGSAAIDKIVASVEAHEVDHGGDGETETTWAVNTYYQSRKDGFTFDVVPLLFMSRAPESHYTVVPPLFWSWGDADETTTIAPGFVWHRRLGDEQFGVLPFYFSKHEGNQHFRLLPALLTMHEGDDVTETTWVANAYFRTEPKGWTFNFAPFYFSGTDLLGHHLYVPPLFWRWASGDSATTVVANTFYSEDNQGYDFGFAPLYFRGRAKAGSFYDFVPPLVWSRGDSEQSTVIAGPVFTHQSSDGWDTGVLPLWLGGRHGGRRYDVVPPLLLYHPSDGQDSTVFALNTYYSSHGDDFELVSFPLVYAGRERASSHTVVAPLYWRYERPDETTHVLLNTMWSYGSTPLGRSWSFHLFPLFDLASYNPDHFLWQVLTGIVGGECQGDMHRSRIAWVWTEPKRDGSH